MTDQSKDEIQEDMFPKTIVLTNNPKRFRTWFFAKADNSEREQVVYTRTNISPPVPDDVAAAIDRATGKIEYELKPFTSWTLCKADLDIIIRAASTPSAEVRALRKALEFYADINNYHNDESPFEWNNDCPVLDRGSKARNALNQTSKSVINKGEIK